MLSVCSAQGCTTLVYGEGRCLVHESRPARKFIRGRPYRYPIAANRRILRDVVGDDSARPRAGVPIVAGPLAS